MIMDDWIHFINREFCIIFNHFQIIFYNIISNHFLWFCLPIIIKQLVRYNMHQRILDIWFNRVISYKPFLQTTSTSLFLKTKIVIHLRQRSTAAIKARWCNVKKVISWNQFIFLFYQVVCWVIQHVSSYLIVKNDS